MSFSNKKKADVVSLINALELGTYQKQSVIAVADKYMTDNNSTAQKVADEVHNFVSSEYANDSVGSVILGTITKDDALWLRNDIIRVLK